MRLGGGIRGEAIRSLLFPPHYSIALVAYTEDQVERLIAALGEVNANPFFVRRSR